MPLASLNASLAYIMCQLVLDVSRSMIASCRQSMVLSRWVRAAMARLICSCCHCRACMTEPGGVCGVGVRAGQRCMW
jgi:hypothetical protein